MCKRSVIHYKYFHQNCQIVWTIVAFDICPYTLRINGGRVRRADEIVL